MIPIDYHLHSLFSEDGENTLEAMCHRAVELDIIEIGFSEHWDVGPHEKNPRFFQPIPWNVELDRLRNKFAGKLIIRAGIEIAEPHLYAKPAAEILTTVPFDYVLGSVHFVDKNFIFDETYFRENNADEVYQSYFAELEKMVQISDIDILAHFDIPSRTGKPIFGYDPARYETQVRRILQLVIDRQLALEVNTGGLRKPAQNLMPDPLILGWYSEMGGVKLTIGSDAHAINQVGLNLDLALAAIQTAGFTHLTKFQQRRPQQIRL